MRMEVDQSIEETAGEVEALATPCFLEKGDSAMVADGVVPVPIQMEDEAEGSLQLYHAEVWFDRSVCGL